MSEKKTVTIQTHSGLGLIWIAGWLFTLGYLGLGFWEGLLAVLVWPYFLGAHFMPVAGG